MMRGSGGGWGMYWLGAQVLTVNPLVGSSPGPLDHRSEDTQFEGRFQAEAGSPGLGRQGRWLRLRPSSGSWLTQE